MNSSLASKRRLLTRIFAFLAIVCFDIHNSIDSTAKSNRAAEADRSRSSEKNHIHAIHNNDHQTTNDTIRISFQLHDPSVVPFRNLFAPGDGCKRGSLNDGSVRTGDIPSSLLLGGGLLTKDHHDHHMHPNVQIGSGRVLDFTTTITSNLKILHMGDSVSIQISEAMDEMMGAHEYQSRHQLWEAYPGADGGTRVAPTRGGGLQGAWRITALLAKHAQGGPDTKNAPGGGWNYHQVFPFLRHVYEWEGRNVTVEKLDVVVFRVMHGWMKLHEITRERVVHAAEFAHTLLGADTMVFLTVPFTNNVDTAVTLEGINKINDMIRDVANNWHLDHEDTHVLVMEYGAYINHVIWTNARHIGYNVSAPLAVDPKVFEEEGPNFLFERLKQTVWPPSIPMVCAKKPTSDSGGAYCDRNILIRDGMHFCAETLAARIGAAVACLLGCVYNRRGSSNTATSFTSQEGQQPQSSLEIRTLKMRACERQCNEQFMSVMHVKESWINTTLASFSGL